MALDKITTGVIADDAITSDQLGVGAIAGSDIAADVMEIKPHIKPGILQPAVAGKDLSGTALGGSYVYGTAHTDGHKYYYTDIKGSRPIKDPRIGAHFGSQRHKCTSLQLLEQETATHGENVYSVDGREWFRATGPNPTTVHGQLAGAYNSIQFNPSTADDWIEVVGYFNNVNVNVAVLSNSANDVNIYIDGTDTGNNFSTRANMNSPLFVSRYVEAGSLVNINVGSLTKPGIHTLKIGGTTTYYYFHSLELIAQDTTSTATKSKIQIPAQNVVSYGKKFSISETAQHYNPFDGMSGAKTLAQLGDYIDTATSLGMENWKAGTSNYYKPFNGGRVVKWVDSSGTIKTSVTMMPPNAQNIGGTASNAFSNAEVQAGTNNHTVTFDTTTLANATPLSEVAKSYYWREFGNGSANGGTGATYADATMLSPTKDNITFVMDDCLTSLSGVDVKENNVTVIGDDNSGDGFYFTFIGTGFTIHEGHSSYPDVDNLVQNLPYGTHVVSYFRGNSTSTPTLIVDGVTITCTTGTYSRWDEVTFHQPKMPPIPEDACIIADYMLMANFVAQGAAGLAEISKGVRSVSCSRDVFYDQSAGTALNFSVDMNVSMGFLVWKNALSGTHTSQLPYFGTDFVVHAYDASARAVPTEYINSTALGTITPTGSTYTEFLTTANTPTLGLNGIRTSGTTDAGLVKFDVATPIHTSSHYQEFETPYVHGLVGGDRNMEQTNLVVTSDGKSWDEVTRDTSYIGNTVINLNGSQGATIANDTAVQFKLQRGSIENNHHFWKKYFVVGWDKVFCLVDGEYKISWASIYGTAIAQSGFLHINGTAFTSLYTSNSPSSSYFRLRNEQTVFLKRGDYIQVKGGHWDATNPQHQNFHIDRLR